MRIQPATININHTEERDALLISLECQISVVKDILTDELPFRPSDIREMAMKSDEEILETLKEIRESINRRALQLEALRTLHNQVKNIPVRNTL